MVTGLTDLDKVNKPWPELNTFKAVPLAGPLDRVEEAWKTLLPETSKVLQTFFYLFKSQESDSLKNLGSVHLFFTLNFLSNGIASVCMCRSM